MTDEHALVPLTRVSDEAEARGLADLFESEGIAHVVMPFAVSQFPTVRAGRGEWGELRVAKGQLDRARELLTSYNESRLEDRELEQQAMAATRVSGDEPEEVAPGGLRVRAVWLLLSVALNILFGAMLWGVYHHRLHHFVVDREGRLSYEFVYDSGARYPKEVREFTRGGHHFATAYDRNLDGRWDERVYVKSGLRFTDRNGDGMMDTASLDRPGAPQVRWFEDHGNGLFNRVERGRDGELGVMEDRDGDGWLERIQCRYADPNDPNGTETRIFDSVRCEYLHP